MAFLEHYKYTVLRFYPSTVVVAAVLSVAHVLLDCMHTCSGISILCVITMAARNETLQIFHIINYNNSGFAMVTDWGGGRQER